MVPFNLDDDDEAPGEAEDLVVVVADLDEGPGRFATKARDRRRKAAPSSTTASAPTRNRRDVLDGIILEDGRRLGDVLDPWQREDFEALGRPDYQHGYLERPRGHDKTGGVGSLAVVELLAGRPNAKLFCFAVDEEQAGLLLEDVTGKLLRGGFVESRAVKIRKREIVSDIGAVLKLMPADVAGSWGLRPDWVAFDEIVQQRDRKLWDVVWTSTGKRPWCRVLCISTPGWDKSGIGWEVREMARQEANWYFSSRRQCASWVSAEWLAQQKRSLPPHVYATQHEGVWTDAGGAWLTAEQVDAIFTDGIAEGTGARVVALDVGLTRDRSVAAVVRLDDATGRYVVELLVTWYPRAGGKMDLVQVQLDVEKIANDKRYLDARGHPAKIVCDPYQFVLGAQQLRLRGLDVVDDAVTATSRDGLFGFARDLVVDGRLKAAPHPELRSELLQLTFEQKGPRLRVDHRPGGFDDHVFAVALGCYQLGKELAPPKRKWLQDLGDRERALNPPTPGDPAAPVVAIPEGNFVWLEGPGGVRDNMLSCPLGDADPMLPHIEDGFRGMLAMDLGHKGWRIGYSWKQSGGAPSGGSRPRRMLEGYGR